uniref:Uncharacterized protein n=1 Tax=Anguilla anguilla TaxID=7936 RepID=A0A0E9VZK1_ANGAN
MANHVLAFFHLGEKVFLAGDLPVFTMSL